MSNLNRITSVEVPSSTDLCRSNCVDVIANVKWSDNVLARRICHISSNAPRPLGTAYVPILLTEVEQEQRPSGNGDRKAIVVGAGLCDGEGERAYTVYDPILDGEKYVKYFLNVKFLFDQNRQKFDKNSTQICSTNLYAIHLTLFIYIIHSTSQNSTLLLQATCSMYRLSKQAMKKCTLRSLLKK